MRKEHNIKLKNRVPHDILSQKEDTGFTCQEIITPEITSDNEMWLNIEEFSVTYLFHS